MPLMEEAACLVCTLSEVSRLILKKLVFISLGSVVLYMLHLFFGSNRRHVKPRQELVKASCIFYCSLLDAN